MATIDLLAPAKINLSLDVLKQRDDGYHIVEMVVQTIGLCDSLSIETRSDGLIEVICDHPYAPGGPQNIAYKAALYLKELAGEEHLGATIRIDKKIPVAAGLAGGSADAAAVLRGLNSLWQLNISPQELARVGLRVGADVPFCLLGGTALARGIGEVITPLPAAPMLWVVLLKPNVGMPTALVYSKFNQATVERRPNTEKLVLALGAGDRNMITQGMANVLESVTFTLLPQLVRLKRKAMEMGALAAQMSGSGPTIFALATDYNRAKVIYQGLKHYVEFAQITKFTEVAPWHEANSSSCLGRRQ